MQYGNRRKQKKTRKKRTFKSYYVVWKPQEKEKNINEEKSLNRTMQYGNAKNPLITAIGLFV